MSRLVYHSSAPTLTNGVFEDLQGDASGNLKVVSGATGSSADQVQGNVADFAADTGNSVKAGAIYSTTPTVRTNGQRGPLQAGTRGGLHVNLFGADSSSGVGTASPSADGTSQFVTALNTISYPHVWNGAGFDRTKKPNASSRIVSAAATTNGTVAKASAGDLFTVTGYNAAASLRYLKFYNKATAPTVGTDTPVLTIALPPTAPFPPLNFQSHYFSAGISYALTTGAADADTGALTLADIVGLNITYQ